MLKTILFTILFSLTLSAHNQIILVLSDDFNSTKGLLYTYEKDGQNYIPVFEPITVNLGRNGMGWGIHETKFTPHQNDPKKQEGDGKTPAGMFTIAQSFGYEPTPTGALPYLYTFDTLVCVDDTSSRHYNDIGVFSDPKAQFKSFERMRREDDAYRLGLVVNYNTDRTPKGGSCIFLHVQKSQNAPTAGCTAMPIEKLRKIIMWLKRKPLPLLIQIPRHYCKALPEPYSSLPCE